ncbi:MAG: alpha/beta hydrolase [Chloroflexi bacterium]|nr:alpha/beta hydrolase [Chloroflexota bacterium]
MGFVATFPISRFVPIQTASVVGLLFLLLAVACGGGFDPESRLVDVGGHRLNIRCSGEGAPAVVLVSGLAIDNHDWETVEKLVSESNLVCSYDRAGLGESGPADGIPTSQTASNNLHSLLSAAGIKGPIILVGHSYGGLIVQLYAAQHPENTAGVVLVDSLQKDNLVRAGEILGDETMAVFMGAVRANPEGVDLAASLKQAGAAGNLGDLPLTVITAGVPDLPPFIDRDIIDRLAGTWLDSQRDLVRLSKAGVHVIAEESGHCIQCDQPELVAEVIRKLAER